jgi:hypothetical protein
LKLLKPKLAQSAMFFAAPGKMKFAKNAGTIFIPALRV